MNGTRVGKKMTVREMGLGQSGEIIVLMISITPDPAHCVKRKDHKKGSRCLLMFIKIPISSIDTMRDEPP